ncbi:MAG: AtpZ/AtpI family protein [Selenomonadaceae bacterium]|nr:AtpZ/AtpI family protein [Selenomonadaceae bacterium]MBR4694851.1 AtpZ/AtpI family protein [Selenomonadaceae bacterium]
MAEEPQKHEGLWQAVRAFSVLSGVGIYLVVVVGICVYLGMMADEHLGISPYGKLTGILLGFPLAIYSLYRQLRKQVL